MKNALLAAALVLLAAAAIWAFIEKQKAQADAARAKAQARQMAEAAARSAKNASGVGETAGPAGGAGDPVDARGGEAAAESVEAAAAGAANGGAEMPGPNTTPGTASASENLPGGAAGTSGGPTWPGPACPACPACLACPQLPPAEVVCRPCASELAEVRRQLGETKQELEKALSRSPKDRYPAPTAFGRRGMAAKNGELLIELPSWGEDLELADEQLLKYNLSPEQKERLEGMYGDFQRNLFQELQKIYADLMGDPNAGTDSTVSALIHSIMELSQKELCRERLKAVMAGLGSGSPVGQPGPDAPACELAVWLLFDAVDRLEGEVANALGQTGSDALWHGTSSFAFTYKEKGDQ